MTLSGVNRKVLVTGGGGFIGSRLVQALLRKEHQVKVLDVQAGPLKDMADPNLELLGIDSSDVRGGMVDKDLVRRAVSDVDVVYHLAINWNGHSWKHTLPLADLFDSNIRGTLNLMEAAKSQGVKHFIFSSSCAVYGESESPSLNEESVCRPELWKGDPGPAYGILKLTAEKLCLMYNYHFGLPITAFRLEVVYEDNETLFLNKDTIDVVTRNDTIEVLEGAGTGTIHVDEVVDAFFIATLNRRAYGQVFNLSNPSTYLTYRELYGLIKQATGSKVQINITKNPAYVSSAPESTEKIQRILGWKPLKTKEDIKAAIKKHAHSILNAS